MLIRESSADLRPGAYLVGAGSGAVPMEFAELRRCLTSALAKVEATRP